MIQYGSSFEGYKGRQVTIGSLVQCYRNLHTGGYSIKDKKTGLVVFHADTVLLTDCTFVVQEKQRQKVLSNQRRSVHAWTVGTLAAINEDCPFVASRVYYNPYRTAQFMEGPIPIKNANTVFFGGKHCYVPVNKC